MIPDSELFDDMKACPFCGEMIKQVAIKCRFCGELLGGDEHPGVFRRGRELIMHKHTQLPARCIKSNEPVDHWLNRSLSWHPRIVYALIVLGILPYALVALITQKKAKIRVPMSTAVVKRRRQKILAAWLFALAGIGTVVAAIINAKKGNEATIGWLLIAGFTTTIVAAIYGVIASNPIKVMKINDSHIWLRGFHPDYLDALPEWPGNL